MEWTVTILCVIWIWGAYRKWSWQKDIMQLPPYTGETIGEYRGLPITYGNEVFRHTGSYVGKYSILAATNIEGNPDPKAWRVGLACHADCPETERGLFLLEREYLRIRDHFKYTLVPVPGTEVQWVPAFQETFDVKFDTMLDKKAQASLGWSDAKRRWVLFTMLLGLQLPVAVHFHVLFQNRRRYLR